MAGTWLLALVCSGCFALSFAPFELWWLSWVGSVALIRFASRQRGQRSDWIALFAVGVAMWLWFQSWLLDVAAVGYPFLALYLSGFTLLAYFLLRRCYAHWGGRVPLWILAPIVLGCVDWLRGFVVLDGYPWFFSGHPLIAIASLSQGADLGGVAVVSLLVHATSGAVVDAWMAVDARRAGKHNHRRRAIIAVMAIAMMWGLNWGYGTWRIDETSEHTSAGPSILAVQTNLPVNNVVGWKREEQERDVDGFARQTIDLADACKAAHKRIDLFVWPETILPGFGLEPDAVTTLLAGGWWPGDRFSSLPRLLSQRIGAPMLVGSPSFIGLHAVGDRWAWREHFNSAYLVEADAGMVRYDKCFLTPFGETMPYISKWQWLEEQLLSVSAVGMTFDLDACATPRLLTLNWHDSQGMARSTNLATPICFEDTVGPVVRRLINSGEQRAGVIVNISNDGWFGDADWARVHHETMARWRCIENRVPMIRVANTGISQAFTSNGSACADKRVGPRKPGGFLVEVMLDDRLTCYAMFGDVLSPLMFLVTILMCAFDSSFARLGRSGVIGLGMFVLSIIWLCWGLGCATNSTAPTHALETPNTTSWGSRAPNPDPSNRQLNPAVPPAVKVEAPPVANEPLPAPMVTAANSNGLVAPDLNGPESEPITSYEGANPPALAVTAPVTEPIAQGQPSVGRPNAELAKSDPERLAIEILTNASSSIEAIYRVHGLEGLEYRPVQLQPIACRLLGDENRGVRYAAAVLVGKKRLHDCAQLLEPLTLDPSPSVRAAALYAMVCLGRTVDLNPLAELAMSPDAETRSNALYVLGELRNPSAIPLVESVVGRRIIDTDPIKMRIVDLQAAESMAKMGDYRQYDPIRAALFAPSEQGEIIALACQMIGETDDRGARGHLIGIWNGKGPLERPIEIRLIAGAALARIGEPNLEPIFQLCVIGAIDPSPVIRAQTAATLGWLGGERARTALALLLNDEAPMVRLAAAAGYLRADR